MRKRTEILNASQHLELMEREQENPRLHSDDEGGELSFFDGDSGVNPRPN